jgi:3D-(3,5/4)-trihydroxycyclohexane-1,2-dione acylhydrolase (decyclizing)
VQNGVVVCAAGSLPGDLHKLWRTSRPGGYHVEYGYSTMGYEIAGGLGVKLAAPEDEVYVMVGDGSYLMLSAELATAVQEGLKLTVVLLDSHGFRSIESLARASGERNPFNAFRLRDKATGELSGAPLPIDFAANARSLGADAVVAEDARALEQALAAARKSARTTVIVAEIDPAVEVPAYDSWWDVPIAEISTSESVREARRAYEERLTTERHLL